MADASKRTLNKMKRSKWVIRVQACLRLTVNIFLFPFARIPWSRDSSQNAGKAMSNDCIPCYHLPT
ncbi:hypothetical protein BCR43DRAFT_73246 [Syncephalastrum racemosum]|uniref:Uncharacterized protein n=1 Tax=Syncephalastrum racemosum TaxID=13706 RepID=A0A1X2H248_SYNRA|nr:hypothetical protein BCR43DRAFT_73246 [Syncephalastrum racemosum]